MHFLFNISVSQSQSNTFKYLDPLILLQIVAVKYFFGLRHRIFDFKVQLMANGYSLAPESSVKMSDFQFRTGG